MSKGPRGIPTVGVSRWCGHALPALLVAAMGCDDGAGALTVPCLPDQSAPYPATSPALGIHLNAQNNDVVRCDTAIEFVQDWHVLEGIPIGQPNVFSPDGSTVYITSIATEPEGCHLHALSAESGEAQWCRSYDNSVPVAGVEVDADGFLYFTSENSVYSLHPDGSDRWTVSLPPDGGWPIGLHMTPDGHVATVTGTGVVYLIARDTGSVLDSLDIQDTYGFVPPAGLDLGGISLLDLLPAPVKEDIERLFGAETDTSTLLGVIVGSVQFSDNTIGVSTRNELYVIGGGEDPAHGALVQIRVEGTPTAPVLVPGWAMPTNAGSGTTPSITFDGRYVTVGDGAGLASLLGTATEPGRHYIVDIDACDANEDANAEPTRCAPVASTELQRGAAIGSIPILPDGTIIPFEYSFSATDAAGQPDLWAMDPSGAVLWQTDLPDGLMWSSVITVSNNHILGTATRLVPSEETLLTITLPSRAESELVILDRSDGSVVSRTPIVDDGLLNPVIGPDGSLYIGLSGILSTLAIETRPTTGLLRFVPTRAPISP